MTDERARQDTSAETPPEPVSAGHMLKEGRERLHLSAKQVAERLRLRQQIVLDLEQDKFDKYVAGTFTRGYIRAYARLVNIDESKVVAAYEALGVDQKPQTMQSFSKRRRQQTQDNRLMLVTYVIGAIIIGSAVIFWLQNNNDTGDEIATQRQQNNLAERMVEAQDTQVEIAAETDETLPGPTHEPIFIDTSMLEPNTPAPTGTATEVTETTAEPPAESTATEPADLTTQENEQAAIADTTATLRDEAEALAADQADQPSQTQSNDNALPDAELVLLFAGDTWIRIEDASGEAIAFGVKPEGHVSALNGQRPYDITLGAPENVSLYFQGEQIELSSYRAGRVARLTVPAAE